MTSIDTILAIEHDTDFNLIEFYFIYRINNNNNNNNKQYIDRIKDGVESRGNSRNRVQINRLGSGSCIVPPYLDTKTREDISRADTVKTSWMLVVMTGWIEFRVNLNSMFISWEKNRRKNRVMGRGGEGIRIRCFFRIFWNSFSNFPMLVFIFRWIGKLSFGEGLKFLEEENQSNFRIVRFKSLNWLS